ncbi:MAG: hypothetical protein IJP74_10250 [Prevotella sp.]|nr:hypothetical protein [Prevotella sp.]
MKETAEAALHMTFLPAKKQAVATCNHPHNYNQNMPSEHSRSRGFLRLFVSEKEKSEKTPQDV